MTIVTRAQEGRHHIAYPYRLGAPPMFAQLVVGPDEVAVFRRHGAIVGTLRSGQHVLSPDGIPFLKPLKSHDGQAFECEILFVSIGSVRLSIDQPVGQLTDASGRMDEFHMMGSVTVCASNPMQLANDGIGMGSGGPGFDDAVLRRFLGSVMRHLPEAFARGTASPDRLDSIGPAVMSAGVDDQLGLAVLGLRVIGFEVIRLVSRNGLAAAGAGAAKMRAQVQAEEALPDYRSCRFGVTRIPVRDTDFGMNAHVSAVGFFQGDRVTGELELWLKDSIVKTLRHAATTWTGCVLDLPAKREEWARYVTTVVVPKLTAKTQLRGRVVIEAVEIVEEDERELKRRRAARLVGY